MQTTHLPAQATIALRAFFGFSWQMEMPLIFHAKN